VIKTTKYNSYFGSESRSGYCSRSRSRSWSASRSYSRAYSGSFSKSWLPHGSSCSSKSGLWFSSRYGK
jgi:hypothetical protein